MFKAKYIKWGIVAITALFSIFLFYLNILYPYFPGDDCIFQLKIPEDGIMGSERIRSLSDLLESQYNFYFNYHYRILNHFILQGLLAFPPVVFDLLNVVVFLLLPICVLQINEQKKDLSYWMQYLGLLFFIWVFHINLGWAYFPATGALNYTWYLIPQLIYLAALLKYNEGHSINNKQLVFLAAINALGNENACIMLCLLTGLVLLMTRKRENRFLYLALLFFIIGGVFMLASPSVGKRLEVQGHLSAGLVAHLMEFTKRTCYYFIRYTPLLLILVFAKNIQPWKTQKNLLLGTAFLAATFSMVLAPLFEPRSAVLGFFVLLMLFVAISGNEWKVWPVVVITSIGILLCFTRFPEFQTQYERHQINEQILEANIGAQELVYLERYCDHSTRDYLLCHENSEDPAAFDNRTLSALYNIKAVALAEKHVQSKRRELIFDSIRSGTQYLKEYELSYENEAVAIYNRGAVQGMDLVILTKDKTPPYYILRGAKRGLNKYLLLGLLPKSIRLYFLDFMEGNTLKKQKVLQHNNQNYSYFYLPDYKAYRYVLFSEYNFDTHSPEGNIYELKLDQ